MNKDRKYQSYPHKWGPGRVHLYVYDSLNRTWHIACRRSDFRTRGREVPFETPITCKTCKPIADAHEALRRKPSEKIG